MPQSDWSQFIPDLAVQLLAACILACIGMIYAYIKSATVRNFFTNLCDRIMVKLGWLRMRWPAVISLSLLFALVMAVAALLFYATYGGWLIAASPFVGYALGLGSWVSWKSLSNRPTIIRRNKHTDSKARFVPIPLLPPTGNQHLTSRFLAPPSGNVLLGDAEFHFEPDSLAFDTNDHIRVYRRLQNSAREVDIPLHTPQRHIKAVYFLINSGNSNSIYEHKCIGEVKLSFQDAPPIVVKLVLGENIREWCPGNPGDFVRQVSSPMVTIDAWTGLSNGGVNAVMDCLKVPVFECMRNCFLEKVVLVHAPPSLEPPDTVGIQFSVFGVSLEIE